MTAEKYRKVAVVNVGDAIGAALVRCLVAQGLKVLAVDETSALSQLPQEVEVLGLPGRLNDVSLGQAVLQGMERWGVPDLLVNNFSTGFLTQSTDAETSDWDWRAAHTVRSGLAATVAFATLRRPMGHGLVLNVGVGRGLIPAGCPMHFSLLGLMRSFALHSIPERTGEGQGVPSVADLQLVNVCLYNLEARRPECLPCAEQVLRPGADDDSTALTETVRKALACISDGSGNGQPSSP